MGPLPWEALLRFLTFSTLTLGAVTAFHSWMSMRIPGLWFALAVAMAGSWFTLRLVGTSALVQCLPWGLAAHMSIIFDRRLSLPWPYALGSILAAGVLIAVGTFDFARHRESRG